MHVLLTVELRKTWTPRYMFLRFSWVSVVVAARLSGALVARTSIVATIAATMVILIVAIFQIVICCADEIGYYYFLE